MSDVKILLVTSFCRVPATSSATRIIFILAKYREHPLLEKAITINKGIDQVNTLSCSINIFSLQDQATRLCPMYLQQQSEIEQEQLKFFLYVFLHIL